MTAVLVVLLIVFAWSAGYWQGRARAENPEPVEVYSGGQPVVINNYPPAHFDGQSWRAPAHHTFELDEFVQ